LIAHQGGWDEIFLFGIPVLVALAAVRFVERRHRRDRPPDDAEAAPGNPDPGDDT
jgi:hypothetical protein